MRQTIKIELTAIDTGGMAMSVQGGNFLTAIRPDHNNPGKWYASWQPWGNCNNCTFAHALEFVTGCIERHFNQFGIDVEFKS